MLRPTLAHETVDRVPELEAFAQHAGHRGRERHRERPTETRASVAIDDHGPCARVHRAIRHLDDATFDAHAKIRIERISRRLRTRSRSANRFLVAKWLVPNSRGYVPRFEDRGWRQRREHGTRGSELHGIRRADGNSAQRGELIASMQRGKIRHVNVCDVPQVEHGRNLARALIAQVPCTAPSVGVCFGPPMHTISSPPTTTTVTSALASFSTERPPFVFIGERLWLDFVNSDAGWRNADALRDFDGMMQWLEVASVVDAERATGMRRRAHQQPAGAAAALVDARRIRGALRVLAERGALVDHVRLAALTEINRVLGRSAGTRRLELRTDGTFARSFVPVGDAFAGLMIPIVESAADALILGELTRVRRCADVRCPRVFYDSTKNGRRRWCDMSTCGNRAKAARHREKLRADGRVPLHLDHEAELPTTLAD